jgi:hypothetical protein
LILLLCPDGFYTATLLLFLAHDLPIVPDACQVIDGRRFLRPSRRFSNVTAGSAAPLILRRQRINSFRRDVSATVLPPKKSSRLMLDLTRVSRIIKTSRGIKAREKILLKDR